MIEVEENPDNLEEWVDVILLTFDGARRMGNTPKEICDMIIYKQTKNEKRKWPDYKEGDSERIIEHMREV